MDLPALLALAAVLAVKEAGLPIPVPGDLLVIGAGVAASRGGLPLPVVVTILVTATVAGGVVQFWLIRGRARGAFLRLLARLGLPSGSVERGTARLRDRGATSVALARMTPGVRIVAIASSAVAGVETTSFLVGLVVGNGVFLTGHFALGVVAGEPAIRLVSGAGIALVAGGVGLAVLGAMGWWLLARRESHRVAGEATADEAHAALDWTDACCPACLVLAAVTPDASPAGR